MNRTFAGILCLIGVALPQLAASDVYVSDTISIFVPGRAQDLGPSRYQYKQLPTLPGARYKLTANTSGDLRVMLCDARNLRRLQKGQSYRCFQKKREGRFTVTGELGRSSAMYAVVKNENVLVHKSAGWRAQVVFPAPQDFKRETRTSLQKMMAGLHNVLRFPEFDLTVEPCGEVNAYSTVRTGDITLCTELMFDAVQARNEAAFLMILFHELGHTLLNLWGEPNYGNERTADEFATVLALIARRQQFVHDWIHWFQENENLAGEIRAARGGDLHMLTPQRVEAIRRVLERPERTIRRWTRTIYPQMTNAGLRDVLQNGHPGDYPELARSILRKRGAL